MIFSRDFSQLELVNRTPLYHQPNFAPWHDWTNCFIELTGQHHFKEDSKFGNVMKCMHDGCPTAEDIVLLSSWVLVNGKHPNAPKDTDLSDNFAYVVYQNLDWVTINNGIFAEEHHVKRMHSMDKIVLPPLHTLIICLDDVTSSGKEPFRKVPYLFI